MPDLFDQLVFFQQPAIVFDEQEQNIEDFRGQRHDFTITQKQAIGKYLIE